MENQNDEMYKEPRGNENNWEMLQFEIQECLMNYSLTQRRVPYSDPDRYIFLLIICLESLFLSKNKTFPSHSCPFWIFPFHALSFLFSDTTSTGFSTGTFLSLQVILIPQQDQDFSILPLSILDISFPCPFFSFQRHYLHRVFYWHVLILTSNTYSSARSRLFHPTPVHSGYFLSMPFLFFSATLPPPGFLLARSYPTSNTYSSARSRHFHPTPVHSWYFLSMPLLCLFNDII